MARTRRLKKLEKKVSGLVKSVSRLERETRMAVPRVVGGPAKACRLREAHRYLWSVELVAVLREKLLRPPTDDELEPPAPVIIGVGIPPTLQFTGLQVCAVAASSSH
jgi:hypothetical protein